MTLADLELAEAGVDEGHVAMALELRAGSDGAVGRVGDLVTGAGSLSGQAAGELPDLAYAACLAGFTAMTPQRLQRLLRGRQAEPVFVDLRAKGGLTSRLMGAGQAPGRRGGRNTQLIDAWRKCCSGG